MSKKKNTYFTSDIALAAYMRLRGLELLECYKDGQRFYFSFSDENHQTEQLALDFINSDCRRYDDEMRSLKKLLYSNKKERSK